jgi:pimeloyl-ACP methyl ester carboxylesterase
LKKVVLFSGLGANERVFDYLDLGAAQTYIVRWIMPLPAESLPAYSSRIIAQIPFEKPVLLGVSFGGMVAVEVSKQICHEQVIIISSAPTYRQIPFYFRWPARLRIHHWLPGRTGRPNRIIFFLLGIDRPEHQKLMSSILSETDPVFLKRAVNMILTWRNEDVPSSLISIHGKNDRLLPKTSYPYSLLVSGGHLIIVTEAMVISDYLQTRLHTRPPSFQ